MSSPRNTAAILKNLNPFSFAFLIRSSIALLALLEFANAQAFLAGNASYWVTPSDGTRDYHYDRDPTRASYEECYQQLKSGKCGAHSLGASPIWSNSRENMVVGKPSIYIYKTSAVTNTSTDQCLKNMAYNILNYDDGFSRTKNIVLGTIIPIAGIIIILGISYFIYEAYRGCIRRVSPAQVADIEAQELAVVPNAEPPINEQQLVAAVAAVQEGVQPVVVAEIPQEEIEKSTDHERPTP